MPATHCAERNSGQVSPRNFKLLLAGLGAGMLLYACSTGSAPLSIMLEHPQTKHSLTCSAKDQLGRTDESVLAGAVENCARTLEARGYVRQK